MRVPAAVLFSISCMTATFTSSFLQAQTANSSGVDPASIERRINEIVAKMTLDEKIGQMSQSTAMATPISDQIKQEIREGKWGSFLNAGSPADRAEAQRIAMNESRLKIPLVFGRDVIHGYRTILPLPIAQSASWDPELIEAGARLAAKESSAEGIHWAFAPMIDITHDPRWGRIAETLGEDPYLTGQLGAAMVRGFQGKSLSDPMSVAACAKHYAAYGAVEAGRDYNSVWLPELLLRDVYLRPFKAVRDAGIASFMTSFNTLNGVPATGNEFLLRQVLRKEWGYDGLVVSDYEAVTEMIRHGYAADVRDAALKAARAGVDMEMVSTAYHQQLKSLVESKQIDVALIDESVRNVLRIKFRLGLFDGRPVAKETVKVTEESRAIAERAATESFVLLKNQGEALPLSKSVKTVAVIGPLADTPVDQMGTWVMDGMPDDVITPLKALRQRLGENSVKYERAMKNSRDLSHDGFAAAVAAAQSADVVLLFLGEEHILSGEARSRAFLGLPGAQDALVQEIAKTGKPVIGVIQAGRPLTFHEAAAKMNAILYAWHGGTMAGPAMVKMLFGETAPSGKLTFTFPRTVGQVPIYYSHLNTGRPASEAELGVPMGDPQDPKGYTSKYVDVDFTPEYPFGFGLSYTKFEYSNMQQSAGQSGLTFSCDVTNAGNRDGDEIVQFYIRNHTASVAQPVRQLKGFQRIHLKAGEKKSVSFTVGPDTLKFYNAQLKEVVEPGKYTAWIAPDSVRGASAEFMVEPNSLVIKTR